jgi:hypothetical protein
VQSDVYRFADRSEKAVTSYFLGQTFASLFADRYLNIPFVMSVDRYWPQIGVAWSHPVMRPDLVGWGSLGWVVIEAKGRTRGLDTKVMQNAVLQKNTIATIGGLPPSIRLAAATHFSGGTLRLRVLDPPQTEGGASDELPGDVPSFLRAYYEPFVEATSDGEVALSFGRRYRVASVAGYDVRVGLDVEVIDAYRTSDSALLTAAQRSVQMSQTLASDGGRISFPDGILVDGGPMWSEERLSQEPWERGL